MNQDESCTDFQFQKRECLYPGKNCLFDSKYCWYTRKAKQKWLRDA